MSILGKKAYWQSYQYLSNDRLDLDQLTEQQNIIGPKNSSFLSRRRVPAIQSAYSLPVFLVLPSEGVFASGAGRTVLVEFDRQHTLPAVTAGPAARWCRTRGWTRGWSGPTAVRALAGHDGPGSFTVWTN